MYSWELIKSMFEFNGPSIEAVLDRPPTAEIMRGSKDKCVIRAEVYGNGIDYMIGENIFM